MKCNIDRLIDYLDDLLSENQKEDVFVHLQNCEICLETVTLMLQDRFFKSPSSSIVEKQTGWTVTAC